MTEIRTNFEMPVDDIRCTKWEIVCAMTVSFVITASVITLWVTIIGGTWLEDEVTRTRVMVAAMALFCLTVVLCCYASKRIGICTCTPDAYDELQAGNIYYRRSVDATNALLSGDAPPSYHAVAETPPNPPSYTSVKTEEPTRVKIEEPAPVQDHHKATG